MIIEKDVEDFLEHFGVPGMRWGFRKQRLQSHLDRLSRKADGTASSSDLAAIRRRRINTAKTVAVVGGVAAVAAGGLFAKKFLKERGGVRAAIRMARINRGQSQALLKMHAAQKIAWGIT
jgi:hypothetical protein